MRAGDTARWTPQRCTMVGKLTSLEAQALVYRSWQFTRDRTKRTQPGRDAFLAKLAAEADPKGEWSEAQRQAAAEAGFTAHMRKMTEAAAVARHSKVCDIEPPHSKADCPAGQASGNGGGR